MRTTLILFILLVLNTFSYGKVKMEVEGAITIESSSSETPAEGTIRYNSTTNDFEGWNGFFWASLPGFSFESGTVTEVDLNTYKTVKISNQWWMAENLKTMRYWDGVALEDGTLAGDITDDITTKYIFDYGNNTANTEIYGKMYTWVAVMNGEASSTTNPSGVQGVCPTGWHVPSKGEWTELINYLRNNGYGFEGSGPDIGKS